MEKLGFFIRFALIVEILAVIALIIVPKPSTEFYLTLTAAILCLLIIVVGTILIRQRKEKL